MFWTTSRELISLIYARYGRVPKGDRRLEVGNLQPEWARCVPRPQVFFVP